MHGHALLAQRLGKRVVLLLGPLSPHHVIEEQLTDVPRGEPGQLQAWPVQDHLAQCSYLGLDIERHQMASSPLLSGLSTAPAAASRAGTAGLSTGNSPPAGGGLRRTPTARILQAPGPGPGRRPGTRRRTSPTARTAR